MFFPVHVTVFVIVDLYYCDNSVESIAESILRIPIYQECRSSEILKELQKQFKLDFSKMISKIQENNNGH